MRDPLDRRGALERGDAGLEQQPHALVGVDVPVDGADLGAEHALERDRHGIHDGDVEPALPGGGRDLGADPAGADHDDRAAAVEPCAQRVGILDAAEVEHAVERRAGEERRRGSAPVASSSRS